MTVHPLIATFVGPFVGLLGAGAWAAGWKRTGLWVTVVGLPGFIAGVTVLALMERYWNDALPAWWIPAAVLGISYAALVPTGWLLGVVAWDRNR